MFEIKDDHVIIKESRDGEIKIKIEIDEELKELLKEIKTEEDKEKFINDMLS